MKSLKTDHEIWEIRARAHSLFKWHLLPLLKSQMKSKPIRQQHCCLLNLAKAHTCGASISNVFWLRLVCYGMEWNGMPKRQSKWKFSEHNIVSIQFIILAEVQRIHSVIYLTSNRSLLFIGHSTSFSHAFLYLMSTSNFNIYFRFWFFSAGLFFSHLDI